MSKLTKAARAALLAAGPQADYHPTIVDQFTDADGEQMVELADGNIEPAEDWTGEPAGFQVGDRVEVHEAVDQDGNTGYLAVPQAVDQPVDEEDDYTPPRPALPRIDRNSKPTRTLAGTKDSPYVSGFCENEQRITGGQFANPAGDSVTEAAARMHLACRGGVINGGGSVTLCQCPHHENEYRCQICGTVSGPDEFDRTYRVCADPEACTDVLHQQSIEAAKTPVSRMIREVKAQARGTDPDTGEPKRRRITTGPANERRQGRPCQCGCALMTGGGLFRPGHDAKLKSALKKAADAGDAGAADELAARGWPGVDPQVAAQFRNEEAKQECIAARVAIRYANQEDDK